MSGARTFRAAAADGDFRQNAAPDSVIVGQAQVVEQILDRVVPTWRQAFRRMNVSAGNSAARLLRERSSSSPGEPRSTRSSGQRSPHERGELPPWGLGGARSLWQSGHLAEAVVTAARELGS
jgi:hypothetical protein